MSPTPEPGLRERKRRATRRAIQLAALQLVRERGLDGVTVDAISARADVSPRTFFNYFDSKDEALLGEPPMLPDPGAIERFVHSEGSLLNDLGELVAGAVVGLDPDSEVVRLRHEVAREHPHLLGLRIAKTKMIEAEIAAIIDRRLRLEHPDADPLQLDDQSRLAAHVAFGVLRHAWFSWALRPTGIDLPTTMRESFARARDLLTSVPADIR